MKFYLFYLPFELKKVFLGVGIIQEYKILQEIGGQQKRKFGKTFLAQNKDAKVIVKQFDFTTKNEHLLEQIRLESTFSFKEDGLPKVIHFSINNNQTTLILQYKKGITIDSYWKILKRKERLPFLIEFLEKFTPILKTLENQKIVHCDIKPSNILIDKTENDFNVHLIDFGLAVKNNESQRKLLFPLGYAAPELILNELSILDSRTDQFSLGVLIWRLYTGDLPLSHRNPSIFTNLQITHPLPSHSKVPKKVFHILKRMTNKHQFSLPPNRMNTLEVRELLLSARNKRYSDLLEIKNDLEKIKPIFYQIKSRR